ncbi:MAG: hypothetical protein M0R74_10415 [Dehalococcoidia bacterium]|nr:hypothetical protein [Dehalococcoidia bacterium]
MNGKCVECHESFGERSVLVCADCGGVFHFPDARIREPGVPCGTHEIGFRDLLGRDVVPLCMRCAVAFRLRYGIPAR